MFDYENDWTLSKVPTRSDNTGETMDAFPTPTKIFASAHQDSPKPSKGVEKILAKLNRSEEKMQRKLNRQMRREEKARRTYGHGKVPN